MTLHWPLTSPPFLPDYPGSFGAVRKHDIHQGLDLYCESGTWVLAIEPGAVIDIEWFTGHAAGSPWWNDTQAVLIRGQTGIFLYGEVSNIVVAVGDNVIAGQPLAQVAQVLKQYKNRPTSMLHLELWEHHISHRPDVWEHRQPRPQGLCDPTEYINNDYPIFDINQYK